MATDPVLDDSQQTGFALSGGRPSTTVRNSEDLHERGEGSEESGKDE